jgi:hypothetical protein
MFAKKSAAPRKKVVKGKPGTKLAPVYRLETVQVGNTQFEVTEVNRDEITRAICLLSAPDRVPKLMEMDRMFDRKPPEVLAAELAEADVARAVRERDRHARLRAAIEQREKRSSREDDEKLEAIAHAESEDRRRLEQLIPQLPEQEARDVRELLRGGIAAATLCDFVELTVEMNRHKTEAAAELTAARDLVREMISRQNGQGFERLRWELISRDVKTFRMSELRILERVLTPAWVECVAVYGEMREAKKY